MSESCKTCRWWEDRWLGKDSVTENAICVRFPMWVTTPEHHYCGEHQPVAHGEGKR